MRGLARSGAIVGVALLLSGCVAVAALPVLAGGAMVAGGHAKIRAATPRPKPSRLAPVGGEMTAGRGVMLTRLTALPAPEPEPGGAPDPWQQFVGYALEHGAAAASGGAARSVVLEAGSSLALPRTRACHGETPAVLLDLDPETRPFIPEAAQPPARALVSGLARLRAAGIAVAWVTALPARYVGEVADVLKASGLDPAGTDPLLLARGRDDRKQVLREEATRDVCVIAIAGDRKSDFDELFDYLRDPAAAVSLDTLLGAGWFLAPPPLG